MTDTQPPLNRKTLSQGTPNQPTLAKNLTLFDVYAISTGAMFSSGFFLLPGIAAAATGPSVYLAYLAAGFLILPAMFSMAELSTAMPKAGGTYYFLDRSLGPLWGTIGGLGSWVAVVFKSAFALVGMGAYLALFVDVPIIALALVLTAAFGAVNLFGAKETTLLQRILVSTLVVILAAFVIKGLAIIGLPDAFRTRGGGGAFFSSGLVGFVATIGLVFVSYAGLTKVASVAEEVDRPDRNIPLGMTLSLITATAIYTLGMLVMLNVLPFDELSRSLTPVADAGRSFLGWLPYDLGVILIVVAACAAFASTANAGILSASRYPFAMAKDALVPERFGRLGRFGTPTAAISTTVVAMSVILIALDVESVAKLASAFQLLLFGLISLCVVVMRESRIETYQPGFRSPLYPWMQIAGILISFWLIVEMGILAIGFTGMITLACAVWYYTYASHQIDRRGAILHVHARLGERRSERLEHELMTIIHDRTRDENLRYESLISRCRLLAISDREFDAEVAVERAAAAFAEQGGAAPETTRKMFRDLARSCHPIDDDIVIWYRRTAEVESPELVVLMYRERVAVDFAPGTTAHTLMFLVVPKQPVGLDLRLAGHLAEMVQTPQFEAEWLGAQTDAQRRDILMRDDHFLHLPVEDVPPLARSLGQLVDSSWLPGSCLLALVERDGRVMTARQTEVLRAGDVVSIIGEPFDLSALRAEAA
ncbi:MAG: amino acid permease [Acidobacteriota bacterium]